MLLLRDCRFAFRTLKRAPGFTLIVLTTLGLCIGANTAVYSVLDALILRAPPYPRPERLGLVVTAWRTNAGAGSDDAQSAAQFETVRDLVPALDCAAFSGGSGANFAAGDHLEYVQQQRVSAGFFRVLGVAPQFGREFTPAEDVPKGPAVVVLSYGFWQRIYRGDTGVIGRTIQLRGEPYAIVGIMPSEFRTAAPVDVWTPLQTSRTGEGAAANYQVVARLRTGASWEQAEGQLKSLPAALLEGSDAPRGSQFEQRMVPFQGAMTQGVRGQLFLVWGAVVMVLLIGCVNIAGLLLARSGGRAHEVATRMALGGGRAAIVRQLLVESLLIGLGGGAAGIAIGSFAIDGLKRLAAGKLVFWTPIELDARVLAAMLAMAILTALLFGLAPAFVTSRVDIRSVLMEGGGRGVSARRGWARQLLVAGEIALSLVLLVGAGLLVRTLAYLNAQSPGFDPRNVAAAQASLLDARYRTSEAVNRLFSQSLERVRRIPGVQSAGVALTLPYQRPLNFSFQRIEGGGQRRMTEAVYVTPGYFETMRIPMLRGRAFAESDTAQSVPVAVVSQSFAAKYFHGEDALGQHIGTAGQTREIVGIAGDVQQHSALFGDHGPFSADPTLYLAAAQTSDDFLRVIHTWFSPQWVVRTTIAKGALAAQLQAAVSGVDPRLPLARFQTVDDLRAAVTRDERLNATLFSIFAGMALLLAAVGLAGLISQAITQRTHELGLRMALGATAAQAITGVIKPGLGLALGGIAAGAALAAAAVRLLRHMIWGVRPEDPMTFLTTAGILLLVAVGASLAPAMRILRMDPARTLRN